MWKIVEEGLKVLSSKQNVSITLHDNLLHRFLFFMIILFCNYITKTPLNIEPFLSVSLCPCIDVLCPFSKLVLLKILLNSMTFVQSPYADLCSLPFCFPLAWYQVTFQSALVIWYAESETGSTFRRYRVAPNIWFKITQDTQGENASHLHQDSVCLVCKIAAVRQCVHVTIASSIQKLFLICSFHLSPSPISSVLCKTWKALGYGGI